jgi:hypothetical protein
MAQDPLFEVFRQIDEQNRMAYLADKLLAIRDEGITPHVFIANADNIQFNQGKTSGRTPCCNIDAWHKYWQINSMKFDNEMVCSSCGKKIYTLTSDPRCIEASRGLDEEGKKDQPENHKAHGGHIYVRSNVPECLYITPLCPYCNGQHEKDIIIRKGSVIVEEICSE